jgi:hypothetical protein
MGQTRRKQKGGGTYKLPGVDKIKTLNEFENKWDTFYISAHGTLLEKKEIVVPDNTYILFMGSAGYLCYNNKFGQEFEQCLIQKEDPCEVRHGSYNKKFLSVMKNLRKVFPSIYHPKKIQARSPSEDVETSIYEPNDQIYDVKLDFYNSTFYNLRGVFQVPLQNDFVNESFSVDDDIDKNSIDKLTDNMLMKEGNLIGPAIREKKDRGEARPNEFLLSDMFDLIKPYQDSSKKTFIVIKTCRAPDVEDPYDVDYYTLRPIRRHSINLRNYQVPLPWNEEKEKPKRKTSKKKKKKNKE